MKKKTTWMLVFTMLSFSAFAQMSNFNLSDYKLPELERRTLEAGFNLNAQNNFRRFTYDPESQSDNAFNTNGSLRYTYFLNSEQWQRSQVIEGSLFYTFINTKVEENLMDKNYRILGDFSVLHENRLYYDASRFVEFNLLANYFGGRYYSYSNPGGTESEDLNFSHSLRLSPSIKAGIGRIEPVQDARQAVYILQELADIARVSPEKSTEEILEFARLISEIKNERFFDSRLKRIYELQMLDSFLLAQNYLLEYDAAYFATMADYWEYGDSPQRLSGQRVSLAFIPGYFYSRNAYNNTLPAEFEEIYKRNAIELYGGVEYIREKPINLTWQNSIDAALYYGWTQQKSKYENDDIWGTTESTYRQPLLQAGFAQRIGYYPSTRTSVVAGYDLQYVRFFDAADESNEIRGLEGNGFRVGGNFTLNYYFSPQLRFNVNWQLSYLWQDSDDFVNMDFFFRPGQSELIPDPFLKSRIYNQFSAGLIYSIF